MSRMWTRRGFRWCLSRRLCTEWFFVRGGVFLIFISFSFGHFARGLGWAYLRAGGCCGLIPEILVHSVGTSYDGIPLSANGRGTLVEGGGGNG